ncbi:hypothetical protein BVX98_03380 [bacterium F11]|nr:hypothetical protein BVX98_03380 [bacterium F11]
MGPGNVEKVAIKEGRLETKGHFGRVVLGPMSQTTFFSGVPPIIKGLPEETLIEWGEPFEKK